MKSGSLNLESYGPHRAFYGTPFADLVFDCMPQSIMDTANPQQIYQNTQSYILILLSKEEKYFK